MFDTTASSVDEFLIRLNDRFLTIKFSSELDREGGLAFLDKLVVRNHNRLELDVYPKETPALMHHNCGLFSNCDIN